ncbi:MAG: TonB-dependent receptor [Woeseiaceae bacterium]|nr:TonB-dependent receptor [Woeseiaceae bacterium]
MVKKKRESADTRADEIRLQATRRSSVSVAVAAALTGALAMPAVTTAQEVTGDEVIEEVITTGYRSSLRNALMMKQNSESIVEAITAEDIGKLPDASIAESLARLPGLTAQRLNGRGQQISVRGLGPDFTTALLNGREQVTTGDNRGVEFDQYPAELLSSVVIYKTPDASLIGAGLAGTADMRTVRPLQHGRQTIAANLRYEWTELDALNAGSADDGVRYTLAYIDQFANDTVGVALGLAHMSNPGQEERFNSWGYPTVTDPASGDDAAIIGGSKPYVRSSELERTGVIGVLEFNPTDRVSTSLDIYYSEFDETQLLRGIELPMQWSAAQLQPGFTVDNGFVSDGQFNGVVGVMRNDITARESDLFAAGFNVNFDLGENWVVDVDLSTSQVDRTDIILETYSGAPQSSDPNNPQISDNLAFTSSGTTGFVFGSNLDYTDTSWVQLTSPQGWGGNIVPGGQLGYDNRPTIDDELNQFQTSIERQFGGTISSMELGLNIATREKSKVADEWFLALASGATEAPISNPIGITDLSFLGIDGMVSYDPLAEIAAGTYTRTRNPNADVVIKSWVVEEDVNTFYAKFGLDSELGRFPLTGNFGFQYMDVDQSSDALAATGDAGLVGQSGGTTWSEFLPSLNLTLDFNNDTFLRFAYARTVARARMDDMRASLNYSFNDERRTGTTPASGPWGGDAGNPELKPWVADAFDLSVEKYFADGAGYVSLAYFYKDIKEYIIPGFPVLSDFTGFPVPPDTMPDPITGDRPVGTFEGFVNRPVNGEGGDITGIEVAVQLSGELIHNSIRNFGLIGNYSNTSSSIEPVPGVEIPIPGLSEDVANVTAYYENDSFSARVSSRYRSDFLGEVGGFGGGRFFKDIKSETVVDAQLSYNVGGRFEGLTLLLQGFNLTDEPLTTFAGDGRLVLDYQRYGRSYMIGASYRYE